MVSKTGGPDFKGSVVHALPVVSGGVLGHWVGREVVRRTELQTRAWDQVQETLSTFGVGSDERIIRFNPQLMTYDKASGSWDVSGRNLKPGQKICWKRIVECDEGTLQAYKINPALIPSVLSAIANNQKLFNLRGIEKVRPTEEEVVRRLNLPNDGYYLYDSLKENPNVYLLMQQRTEHSLSKFDEMVGVRSIMKGEQEIPGVVVYKNMEDRYILASSIDSPSDLTYLIHDHPNVVRSLTTLVGAVSSFVTGRWIFGKRT